ncbi:MAG: hypothetical protein AB7F86_02000 [Bdellovibrionales bacterium]
MRWLCLLALVFTVSCQRDDKYLEVVQPEPPPKKPRPIQPSEPSRFSKNYLLHTTSSEIYAVDVDIIWVVDNSISMDPYQQALIDNSSAFISQFATKSKLHWKMGVLSTAIRESPYLGFNQPVDWRTPGAINLFNGAINRLGLNGDTTERAFSPILRALNSYPNFLRPGAYLVLILVSDEEEQSGMTIPAFLQALGNKLGGDTDRVITYGVYGPDSNRINTLYDDIVQATNGIAYDITSPDYGILLSNMGQDLVQKISAVHPVIMLDQQPKSNTIEVAYKGRKLIRGVASHGGEWTYNPNYNLIEIQNPDILDPKVLDVEVSFELLESVN